MSENYIKDVFTGAKYYYEYSCRFSSKPKDFDFAKEETVFDKNKEVCETENHSWIDDNGFI